MKRIFFVLLGLLLIVTLKAQVVYPVRYLSNNVVIRGYLVVEGPTTMPYLIVEDSLKINGQVIKHALGDTITDPAWVRAYVAAHGGGGTGGGAFEITNDTAKLTAPAIVSIDSAKFRTVTFVDTSLVAPNSSVTLDLSRSNVWFITTSVGGFTLDYSNAKIGTYTIQVTQGATPRPITWATGKFIFPDGLTPALTNTGGAIDLFSCFYNGSKMIVSTLYDCK